MEKQIELLDLPIPHHTNLEIIQHLGGVGWHFANDKPEMFQTPFVNKIYGEGKHDHGMHHTSLENKFGNKGDPFLNNMGYLIYHMCNERSKYKMREPRRMYWNFYTPNAICDWHCDEDTVGHCVSVLYNLHDNDGGTEFKDGTFIQSKEGQALVFPSYLVHKGIAPKTFYHRFNLNMIVHLQDFQLDE
jgi:hypothetical protein